MSLTDRPQTAQDRSTTDSRPEASACVAAGPMRRITALLAVRERLLPPAPATHGAIGSTVGLQIARGNLTIDALDGRLQMPVPSDQGRGGSPVGSDSAILATRVNVLALDAMVAEVTSGVDQSGAVRLAFHQDHLSIEAVRPQKLSGRHAVAREVLAAFAAVDIPTPLPLVLAFGLRAAHRDRAAAAVDAGLIGVATAMRDELSHRDYDLWCAEIPRWSQAIADLAAEGALPSVDKLQRLADARLAAVALTSPEIDRLALLTLTSVILSGQASPPSAVATPIAVAALRQLCEVGPTLDLLPSEAGRVSDIVTDHVFSTAVARALTPDRRRSLGALAVSDDSRYTRRSVPKLMADLASGRVREVDPASTLRLTAIPPNVLRAALDHAGALAPADWAAMSPDDTALVARFRKAWPSTIAPLSGGLRDAALATVRRAVTETETRKTAANRERGRRIQRESRHLAIEGLLPAPEGASIDRRRIPATQPVTVVPRVAAAPGRAIAAGAGLGMFASDHELTVTLPPAVFARAASEWDTVVVLDVRSGTAVIVGGRLLGVWSPAGYGATAVHSLLRRPSKDLIAMTGDELSVVRALGGLARPGEIARPQSLADDPTRLGCVAYGRFEAAGVRLAIGDMSLIVPATRQGVVESILTQVTGRLAAAEPAPDQTMTSFRLDQDALAASQAALVRARVRQGELTRPELAPSGDIGITIDELTGGLRLRSHDHSDSQGAIVARVRAARLRPSRSSETTGSNHVDPVAFADALEFARATAVANQAPELRFAMGGTGVIVERRNLWCVAISRDLDARLQRAPSSVPELAPVPVRQIGRHLGL